MLTFLRDYILEKRFGSRTHRGFTNWDKIKNICIVAGKNEFFDHKKTLDLLNKQGKNVDVVIFNSGKDALADTCYMTINKPDLGFLSIPKQEIANKLRSKKYDVLIDCNESGSPVSKAITMCVEAKCKTGHKGLYYSDLFDISMDIKGKLDFGNYLNHTLNYLMMIKTIS